MQSDFKKLKKKAEQDSNQNSSGGELKAPVSLPPVQKFKLADEELLEQYRKEKNEESLKEPEPK